MTDKGRVKLHQIPAGRRLSPEDKDTLFIHLIRFPALLAAAQGAIEDAHFADTEHYLRVLWMVLVDLTEREYPSGGVPQLALRNGVKKWLDSGQSSAKVVSDTEAAMLLARPVDVADGEEPGIIYEAYRSRVGVDIDYAVGLDLLKRFYAERGVNDLIRSRLVPRDSGTVFLDVAAGVDQLRRAHQRLMAIDGSPIGSVIPEPGSWAPAQLWTPAVPYLIPVMDGFCAPEIYGLVGVIGAGKTTLSVQLACRSGEYFATIHRETARLFKHVVYFFYEGSMTQIQTRCWSLMGEVSRKRLLRMSGSLDDPALSRRSWPIADRPHYEHALAKAHRMDLADFPGEYERLRKELGKIVDNVHFIDMSGKAGHGGVAEIAGQLARLADKGLDIGMVVVDYVGLAVRRMLRSKGLDVDRYTRHGIDEFIDEMEESVNKQFACCSWNVHQIAGAETAKKAGVKLHHSQAAGNKSYAERLDLCLELGNKDAEGMVRLDCSKSRRTENTNDSVVIKLVGDLGRFDYVPNVVCRDGVFVDRDVVDRVGGDLRSKEPTLRREFRAVDDEPEGLHGMDFGDKT